MNNNLSFHFQNCLLNPNHSKSDYRHDNLWNKNASLSMSCIKFSHKYTDCFLTIQSFLINCWKHLKAFFRIASLIPIYQTIKIYFLTNSLQNKNIMLVTVSNFEYIFKYCCPIKFNILSLSIVGMFHLWLFLQQRCKIFVAICLPQKSKPQRSLMQLFVSIFTNYKCFGISCRTTK